MKTQKSNVTKKLGGLFAFSVSLLLIGTTARAEVSALCEETERSVTSELAQMENQKDADRIAQCEVDRAPTSQEVRAQKIRENQMQRKLDWERGFVRGFGSGGV